MRIGIGSAQFGMDYGISNTAGVTPRPEVERILACAAAAGVGVIDTAPLYGGAEQVLGDLLPAGHGFDIVTKTPSFKTVASADRPRRLRLAFDESLARLRASSVYGLLVHHAEDLLDAGGPGLFAALEELKREGRVRKIGASAYSPEQVDQILQRFRVDLIQVPVNVLDQRFLLGGHLDRLREAGIEIHARSVFLQGLLLMKLEALPGHFDSAKPLLDRYHRWIATRRLDATAAAAGFVAGLPQLGAAIFGVESRRQLEEIVARCGSALDPAEFHAFAVADRAIVDPTTWPAPCARSA